MNLAKKTSELPWHTVEKAISKEITWLKSLITSFGYHTSCRHCEEHAYRQLALLIITGKIKAREIKNKKGSFWGDFLKDKDIKIFHKHGKDWHQKMMSIINQYFSSQGFDVTTEPNLNNGRADLGIFSLGMKDLYIEVGTVSIYKMWINLSTMKNCVFLCIPDEHTIIEFETFHQFHPLKEK